jgi:hypothetical protein
MSMGYRHRRVIFVVLLFGFGAVLLLVWHHALVGSVVEVVDVIPHKVIDNHDSWGPTNSSTGENTNAP